jgi:hypothetical protein
MHHYRHGPNKHNSKLISVGFLVLTQTDFAYFISHAISESMREKRNRLRFRTESFQERDQLGEIYISLNMTIMSEFVSEK